MSNNKNIEIKNSKGELAQQVEFLGNMASLLLQRVEALSPEIDIMIEEGIDFKNEIKEYETRLIKKALEHTKGNQKKAAQLLNLKVTTLHSKIKALGI